MDDPTSSYANTGIALRVSGALKPHHHDKVETPSVGYGTVYTIIISTNKSMLTYQHSFIWQRRHYIVSTLIWSSSGESIEM
jgi:hypothetical protein